jgi:hypothetical protein
MAARRKSAPEPAPKAKRAPRAAPAAVKAKPARQAAVPRADPTTRLHAATEKLEAALAELPRGAEFEPLAEHLYEFARMAPALVEALGRVPAATEPVQAAVRSLQEISETLQYTQESFAESVLGLPTAQEYEPLVEPLTEFARVAPQLAASLKDVLGATMPMRDTARVLERVCERLERLAEAQPAPLDERLARIETLLAGAGPAADLADVRADVVAARDAVRAALAGLPRDEDYGRVAAQLRELATVSPSLMDWLQQVATVQAPLQGSVDGLAEALRRLDRAAAALDQVP